jgi:exo-1,4-beta-D-glucosaminidase
MIELSNHKNDLVTGIIFGEIEGITSFQQLVTLNPKENKKIFFNNHSFPQLNINNPKLWWPWQMGEPIMQTLKLKFLLKENYISDILITYFGIRQITSEIDKNNHRLFKINQKPILIRLVSRFISQNILRKTRKRISIH